MGKLLSVYLKACYSAIFTGWGNLMPNDMVSGSCFYILFYGVKSSIKFILLFLLRTLFVVIFPLTALLVIYSDNYQAKRTAEIRKQMERDL